MCRPAITPRMARPSRRALLASLGAAAAALAGCASEDGPGTASSDPGTSNRTGSPAPTATTTPGPATAPGPTATPTVTTETPSPTEPGTATPTDLPTTGPSPAGVTAFDDAIPGFLAQWGIPGATVAAMRDGRLAVARGYGYAGPDTDEPVTPGALCRVGSISKPVTAAAVLDLVERGALSLDDRAVELLADLVPAGGPADERVADVTVRQLLRHTAGWDRRQVGFDPVFAPRRVAEAQGTDPPASAETTVEYMFDQQLGYDPGTGHMYSNFGYCLLGRIVEAVSGTDYESHVTGRVLDPLGAGGMHLGATRRENLHPDEVRYLSHGTGQSPFPGGGQVPRPYGQGVLREALDANGGWVGSVVDLLRFVRGVDGRGGSGSSAVPDVLDAETRETMLARPDLARYDGAAQYYAMGWVVNHSRSARFYWHNGSIPGSYGFLAHFEGPGVTLAALFNGRAPVAQFQQFNAAAQQTLIGAFDSVTSWPERDLFDRF